MPDNLTREQRSYAMSRIRSRGNNSTEKALIVIMRRAGIAGWRRKMNLCGKPDFVFPNSCTVVFVDGCFWHGCTKCGLASKSNRDYWGPKIKANVNRDRTNTRLLRDAGWKVVRIWEHDLKSAPVKCLQRIVAALGPSEGR
jgi:DNA mismatch endonuclease, patch repair protein